MLLFVLAVCYFLLLGTIPLYDYSTVCLIVLLLTDTETVSSLEIL